MTDRPPQAQRQQDQSQVQRDQSQVQPNLLAIHSQVLGASVSSDSSGDLQARLHDRAEPCARCLHNRLRSCRRCLPSSAFASRAKNCLPCLCSHCRPRASCIHHSSCRTCVSKGCFALRASYLPRRCPSRRPEELQEGSTGSHRRWPCSADIGSSVAKLASPSKANHAALAVEAGVHDRPSPRSRCNTAPTT